RSREEIARRARSRAIARTTAQRCCRSKGEHDAVHHRGREGLCHCRRDLRRAARGVWDVSRAGAVLTMRALFILGVILIILGVASLFVPIPVREKHGFKAGPVSVGVETTEHK